MRGGAVRLDRQKTKRYVYPPCPPSSAWRERQWGGCGCVARVCDQITGCSPPCWACGVDGVLCVSVFGSDMVARWRQRILEGNKA